MEVIQPPQVRAVEEMLIVISPFFSRSFESSLLKLEPLRSSEGCWYEEQHLNSKVSCVRTEAAAACIYSCVLTVRMTVEGPMAVAALQASARESPALISAWLRRTGGGSHGNTSYCRGGNE